MAKRASKTASDKAATAAAPAGAGSAASADTDKTIFIGRGDEPAFLTL